MKIVKNMEYSYIPNNCDFLSLANYLATDLTNVQLTCRNPSLCIVNIQKWEM